MIANVYTAEQVFWGGFATGAFCAVIIVLSFIVSREYPNDDQPREDQW